jgi:hypothetical protein
MRIVNKKANRTELSRQGNKVAQGIGVRHTRTEEHCAVCILYGPTNLGADGNRVVTFIEPDPNETGRVTRKGLKEKRSTIGGICVNDGR